MSDALTWTCVVFTNAVQAFFVLILLDRLLTSVAGVRHPGPAPASARRRRFAVVIPAHDEEAVIGPLLDSLARAAYPKDALVVHVVADNCADRTAEIARARGATVHERRTEDRRRKGYALAWAVENILKDDPAVEAFLFLDADNLAHPDLPARLDDALAAGALAVQAYKVAKNPFDNVLSAFTATTQIIANRFGQLGRSRLGMGATLWGSGMAFTREVMERHPWDGAFLLEDMELTIRLQLAGIRTAWAHDAVVYDEMPVRLWDWFGQRLRWTRGHVEITHRYLFKLLGAFLRRPGMALMESVQYAVLGHGVALSLLASLAAGVIPPQWNLVHRLVVHVPWPAWTALALWPLVALRLEGAAWRCYLVIWTGPLFTGLRPVLWFISLFGSKRARWHHTRHTRALTLDDVLD